ncbi:ABC transporter ATP-binding protein [Paenibacillus sp. ACRRX]|uniref:ABC transporter ATP-binding protein n=1 Tax=unclassified Paenibacillus TaxID=185978 RepID=UPI001EF4BC3C|nr:MULTISPECIES: ABC transporter ATP-binding protein [unclassified Paenibacillus]MCG7406257.1 ABC transporter ATP-binding protein [Paenibacillus sp. ACRRX]MDK8179290.1 ABC transporter ATP-binding protein [Paenibacillus sp. UMB4589-SE434]
MEPLLRAEQITKVYGTRGKMTYTALQDIHLQVEAGEFVGIMGPSGSGKTTLLNLLATIDKPTSGNIYINGTNPYKLNNRKIAKFRRHELGFVFQDFNLIDTLTIKENIILPLALDRLPIKEIEARLESTVKWLGIDHILDRRPYEISGGQKQRTAIARAVIHQPSLLLADELTGNLDSKAAKDVMKALQDLNENLNRTILIVTHDPFAASFCKRILFIKDGKLFTEIRRGTNRQTFFQQILDTLSLLGGNFDDIPTARFQ